jgi:hypothetical protein
MAELAVNGGEVVDAPVPEVAAPEAAAPVTEELTPAQRAQLAAESAATEAVPQTNGKKKTPTLDVASDEAFPSLGGARTPVATAKWGAGTNPIVSAASEAPRWTPSIATGGGQIVCTLLKEDKATGLRRAAGDIVRDIARKTNTKIDAAHNNGSTTYIILGGSSADRERAKREIMRELAAKVGFYWCAWPAGSADMA